jgi:isoleucyl-tRNA synthetase
MDNKKNNMKKSDLFRKEQEILKFWSENKIFEKSLEKDHPAGEYSFYDGPPFATGLPHYGHIVASLIKDVFPRYKTMQGYSVKRKWGWDCHGLPVESLVEKDLKINSKDEIEAKIGVDKFNESCRACVMKYADEWKKFIPTIGRWVDMENDYKTMDPEYMESIWWVFKTLWEKGLIYEGYKSMHICPHCETTLSNFEVSQGYKDIKDLSVTAKFELESEPGTFLLAWTTTPWTLAGNVALAVGENMDYVKVELEGKKYILAKELVETVLEGREYKIIEELKGKDLVGKVYKPLFDYYSSNKDLENRENGWKIYKADFVTIEDGTGIVHIAPAFGEDDMNLGQENNLPFIQHVASNGFFTEEMGDLAGQEVKPKEDFQKTDVEIIKYLAEKNLLFSKEKYEHSYPHCWRCDAPLLNYATKSWFVKVTEIKDKIISNNQKVNWVPDNFKEGRMGKWLEGTRDWSISRQRYWGSVMPIWKCDCGEIKVIGSIEELEKLSGQKVNDLHKHVVDQITFKCEKCNQEMKRIPDVLDCWFESGSMPYASIHYPFDPDSLSSPSSDNYGARNKEGKYPLPKGFPCNFIAEGQDQTRGWFYTLLVLSTALFDQPAFLNVVVNGMALAEDGKKMSKRLRNYPDPLDMIHKYSADTLRYYLLSSPIVKAGDLCFSEKDLSSIHYRYISTLRNVVSFYNMYAQADDINFSSAEHLLDKWILAKLKELKKNVTDNLEKYELKKAVDPLGEFILELSTWYIRRSRDRFKEGDALGRKTLHYVILEFSKLISPFMPFLAEDLYKQMNGDSSTGSGRFAESVHLDSWPLIEDLSPEETKLMVDMETVRKIVEKSHNLRDQAGIKVRQPLSSIKYHFSKEALNKKFEQIIAEEVNVKVVEFSKEVAENEVDLDTELTPELKDEGHLRELVRQINSLRKKAQLTIKDKVKIYFSSLELEDLILENKEFLQKNTLAEDIIAKEVSESLISKEVDINGFKVKISLI